MNIGQAMKTIRDEHSLSQREMAAMLGITPAALCKIETGKRTPRMSTVDKFCTVTRTPKAYVFLLAMGAGDMPPTESDREDCQDIINLATLRIRRTLNRK